MNKKVHKAILKAVLLLSVYCLHLVFFQAAMAHSKDKGTPKFFKTYLSYKANQKKGKASPASFYIQFVKLAINAERPTVSLPVPIAECLVPEPTIFNELPPVSQWLVYAHLPEDAFKIYQRLRVFLI